MPFLTLAPMALDADRFWYHTVFRALGRLELEVALWLAHIGAFCVACPIVDYSGGVATVTCSGERATGRTCSAIDWTRSPQKR